VELGLRRLGGQKRPSFCLSVTLLNVSLCARFRHEGVETETVLMPVDRGRFVVVLVHQCSAFSARRKPVTPQNADVNKMVTFGVFLPPEGDKIYRSR